MKYLKSTSEDLKLLFNQHITVKHIAESFRSFDDDANTATVKNFMKNMDFDVIGIREKGKIIGYALQNDLNGGNLKNYFKKFDSSDIISGTTSIAEVFNLLIIKERVYIESFNEVAGIITKGDLQKHPVRMWLFGIISLVEMQMLRIIRDFCPNDLWKKYLKEERINEAQNIFNQRSSKNEHIDLVECLQLSDKKVIILKNDKIFSCLGDTSKRKFEDLLAKAELIRNNIAHSQDFLEGFWPDLTDTINDLLILLKKCEKINNIQTEKL